MKQLCCQVVHLWFLLSTLDEFTIYINLLWSRTDCCCNSWKLTTGLSQSLCCSAGISNVANTYQIGPDWHQIGRIWDFLIFVYFVFMLYLGLFKNSFLFIFGSESQNEQKTDLSKSQDLSHLVPICPQLEAKSAIHALVFLHRYLISP